MPCFQKIVNQSFLCEYNLPHKHPTITLQLDVMCDIPWTFFSNSCILLKELRMLNTKQVPMVSGMYASSKAAIITDCREITYKFYEVQCEVE